MSTADMSAGDIVAIVSGLAGIYFAWQQNRIFKEQNKIFAAQAGSEMPEKGRRWSIAIYWPTIAAIMASLLVGFILFWIWPSAVAFPWALNGVLAFGIVLALSRLRASKVEKESLRDSLAKTSGLFLNQFQEGKTVTVLPSTLFTPLQIEIFSMAKELREFLGSIGPRPAVDKSAYGYDFTTNRFPDSTDQVHAYHDAKRAAETPWEQRLHFGYILIFSSKMRELMLRVGEIGYPMINPDFANTVSDETALLKLAADLDLMAIFLYSQKNVFGHDWPAIDKPKG